MRKSVLSDPRRLEKSYISKRRVWRSVGEASKPRMNSGSSHFFYLYDNVTALARLVFPTPTLCVSLQAVARAVVTDIIIVIIEILYFLCLETTSKD